MARTTITPQVLAGSNDGFSTLSFTSFDVANGMQCACDGYQTIILRGTGAATVTLVSVEDPYGNTGDRSVTLANGDVKYIGPVNRVAFRQTDGKMYLNSTAACEVCVLQWPY